MIYPNDHPPAHVHVVGRGCEALFNLNCPNGPVELRENYRFSQNELSQIVAALSRQVKGLCQEWERIHGVA